MQTQLLAPIVCAISVDSQAEVVNWVNENVYGTGVRIFSRKRDSYLDLIKQIEVGRIVFNSGSMLQRDLPIEGWKQSGKGKILS